MSVIRNTEVTVIRSQLCNTSNGHASGTPANRPYNGGVRNSEARNIEVPLYIPENCASQLVHIARYARNKYIIYQESQICTISYCAHSAREI